MGQESDFATSSGPENRPVREFRETLVYFHPESIF